MLHSPIARLATISILATFASACAPEEAPVAAQLPVGEWRADGADKAGTKYSPLDEINRETIGNLRIAWQRPSMPD
jgi:quinoprotein glucose dehydrogenase